MLCVVVCFFSVLHCTISHDTLVPGTIEFIVIVVVPSNMACELVQENMQSYTMFTERASRKCDLYADDEDSVCCWVPWSCRGHLKGDDGHLKCIEWQSMGTSTWLPCAQLTSIVHVVSHTHITYHRVAIFDQQQPQAKEKKPKQKNPKKVVGLWEKVIFVQGKEITLKKGNNLFFDTFRWVAFGSNCTSDRFFFLVIKRVGRDWN